MKIIIVDDEMFARKRVVNLLQQTDGYEILAECSDGHTAIEKINSLLPDLVFLDINIRDMNGFEVLEKLNHKPHIVFITAHDDFAVKAFDYEALDYLVKPFTEERFFKTLQKVQKPDSYLKKISVKQGNKTKIIATENIHYILSSGVYVEIFTSEGKFVHRESLNQLEKELNPNHFLRVHRSAIIHLGSVVEIVHSEYSEIDARMKDQALVRISKSQKKLFLSKMKH